MLLPATSWWGPGCGSVAPKNQQQQQQQYHHFPNWNGQFYSRRIHHVYSGTGFSPNGPNSSRHCLLELRKVITSTILAEIRRCGWDPTIELVLTDAHPPKDGLLESTYLGKWWEIWWKMDVRPSKYGSSQVLIIRIWSPCSMYGPSPLSRTSGAGSMVKSMMLQHKHRSFNPLIFAVRSLKWVLSNLLNIPGNTFQTISCSVRTWKYMKMMKDLYGSVRILQGSIHFICCMVCSSNFILKVCMVCRVSLHTGCIFGCAICAIALEPSTVKIGGLEAWAFMSWGALWSTDGAFSTSVYFSYRCSGKRQSGWDNACSLQPLPGFLLKCWDPSARLKGPMCLLRWSNMHSFSHRTSD